MISNNTTRPNQLNASTRARQIIPRPHITAHAAAGCQLPSNNESLRRLIKSQHHKLNNQIIIGIVDYSDEHCVVLMNGPVVAIHKRQKSALQGNDLLSALFSKR